MTHKKIYLPLILHDSIGRDTLQSFIDMRSDGKKPMTQRALDMLIKKLSRLESQGHCPNLLLEKSIIGSYQDVYPDDSTRKHVPGSFVAIHTDKSWANVSFMEKHTDKSWRKGL